EGEGDPGELGPQGARLPPHGLHRAADRPGTHVGPRRGQGRIQRPVHARSDRRSARRTVPPPGRRRPLTPSLRALFIEPSQSAHSSWVILRVTVWQPVPPATKGHMILKSRRSLSFVAIGALISAPL